MSDIDRLSNEIASCRICIDAPLGQPLPHEPRPVVCLSSTARLCIAGQAPGLRVHNSGKPFTDPSGERLREWMGIGQDVFYDTEKIAIVPMGFCFPGYDKNKSDLPPRKECRLKWHNHIFEAMPQIELMLVIGQYAQAYHMPDIKKKSMTETVMNWRKGLETGRQPAVLALPHPSWRNTGWLKKNQWFEREVLPRLQSEVKRLI